MKKIMTFWVFYFFASNLFGQSRLDLHPNFSLGVSNHIFVDIGVFRSRFYNPDVGYSDMCYIKDSKYSRGNPYWPATSCWFIELQNRIHLNNLKAVHPHLSVSMAVAIYEAGVGMNYYNNFNKSIWYMQPKVGLTLFGLLAIKYQYNAIKRDNDLSRILGIHEIVIKFRSPYPKGALKGVRL